jgi:hypothetical protein
MIDGRVLEAVAHVAVRVLVHVLGVHRQHVGAALGRLGDGRVVERLGKLGRVVVLETIL